MRDQFSHIVQSCFGSLRQQRSFHRYVTVPVLQMLVTSLVLSRLPANQIRRLQSVQNAAAWLIFNIRRSDHVTDALVCLLAPHAGKDSLNYLY